MAVNNRKLGTLDSTCNDIVTAMTKQLTVLGQLLLRSPQVS